MKYLKLYRNNAINNVVYIGTVDNTDSYIRIVYCSLPEYGQDTIAKSYELSKLKDGFWNIDQITEEDAFLEML